MDYDTKTLEETVIKLQDCASAIEHEMGTCGLSERIKQAADDLRDLLNVLC